MILSFSLKTSANNMSETTEFPHIYKKGQIFKLKRLTGSTTERRFLFGSLQGTLPGVIRHCNNLNEITSRCLLGIWKLNSFFGISRDPTDKPNVSKGQSVYNKARIIFKGGGDREFLIIKEELENLLQNQESLAQKLEEINSRIEPEPLTKEKLVKLEEILSRLDKNVKTVLGIE